VGPARSFTLGELARALGADLEGDPARVVRGVAPLDAAGPDDVSFLTNPRYRAQAEGTRAAAILVSPATDGLRPALLRVPAPQVALIALLELFFPAPPVVPGVHPTALVDPDARIAASASVGPFAVIEAQAEVGARSRIGALAFIGARARLGEDVVVHPRAVVAARVDLGHRVIVHAGAVLGSDGFGFALDEGRHRRIPQVGTVRVEDDVEIGANATVARAAFGETVIARGAKIDNLVQVAHNCRVGEHAILAAQVGIAGSSRIGSYAMLGGQVGVADHVTLADGTVLFAQAGVGGNLGDTGGIWGGSPCRPVAEWRRIQAAERRLPELLKRVRALEERVRELEGRHGG
jgi:UDP-3-O-[3-hydroxymyristoyl] glucosamine N-acyltransferase